ncbi:MAG: hypothetical protein HRT37_04415 [Alteromonadaceae bacterium]|nr:hypothetical protein [Alteromonadaceae bacterium]
MAENGEHSTPDFPDKRVENLLNKKLFGLSGNDFFLPIVVSIIDHSTHTEG